MGHYSIKDLENLTGIKAHTIRMWEQRYGIMKPNRTDTNIRLYDIEDLKLMLNFSLLNNHGHKISHIAQMSADEVNKKVLETLSQEKSTFDDQINALALAMVDLDEDQFERLMANNILQQGFETTMIEIIYPFLFKIGSLWMTNTISPAQEHFITNLIRQKLIVAIDGCFSPNRVNPKKFMLFLPEGELHEISLLFSYYLIKSRGNKVIYLGQSLPIHDLEGVYEIHTPHYLFTILTSVPSAEHAQEYVNTLATKFPTAQMLISGYQVVGQDIQAASNVTILNQVKDLIVLLDALKNYQVV